MPDGGSFVEQPKPPAPAAEASRPQEGPKSLGHQDIRRIALNPTREQLDQLASKRAKERGGDEYKGGHERKDGQWAQRLTRRYERAHATNEHLSAEVARARSAARWGNQEQFDRWQSLKAEQGRVAAELGLLAEPFRQADLTLDASQIPPPTPTLGERAKAGVQEAVHRVGETVSKPVQAVRSGVERTIQATRSRVDGARSGIAVWVTERVLSAKGTKDQATARLNQLRTELGTATGEAVNQKKAEIKGIVDAIRSKGEQASQLAVSSVRSLFERAKQKARETLGPFVEMVGKDREAVRAKATGVSEQLARMVQVNRSIADEVISGIIQQAQEKAGAALGVAKGGLGRLREAGGAVVNEFNERVSGPVAQEFRRRKEVWGLRVQSAKGRLNRMFAVYADAAGPVLNVGRGVVGRVGEVIKGPLEAGEKGVKAAAEIVRGGKERLARTYEAVSGFVVSHAVDLWSRTEGLSKDDVLKRAALLKARLANVSQLARQAGLKAEEATAFGIAIGSMGAEKALQAIPKSTRGRLLLAGGVAVGGLAVLAMTHPDVFTQMQDALSQLTQGHIPSGTGEIAQAANAASAPTGAEQVAGQVASNIPGSEIVQGIGGAGGPPPGAEVIGQAPTGLDAFAGIPPPPMPGGAETVVAQAPANFADFLSQVSTIRPGDTLWNVVSGQAAHFGNWVNPENGVTKGDVVADIVRQFSQQTGGNPDLIHPGETFSLAGLNFPPEQLQVIKDALDSTSPQQYINEVMPKFEALLTV